MILCLMDQCICTIHVSRVQLYCMIGEQSDYVYVVLPMCMYFLLSE